MQFSFPKQRSDNNNMSKYRFIAGRRVPKNQDTAKVERVIWELDSDLVERLENFALDTGQTVEETVSKFIEAGLKSAGTQKPKDDSTEREKQERKQKRDGQAAGETGGNSDPANFVLTPESRHRLRLKIDSLAFSGQLARAKDLEDFLNSNGSAAKPLTIEEQRKVFINSAVKFGANYRR
jgi:hypothetical protein